LVVFISGEGPPNVLLLPVQLRSPSVDHFFIYCPISTFNVVALHRAARLASELAVSGHPIEVLVYQMVAGVP
jgi:hypothetical protein